VPGAARNLIAPKAATCRSKTHGRGAFVSWYHTKVQRDLARWQSAGWVSDSGAAAIKADLAARKPAFGAAAGLAILGAVLFGFAVVSFVAANWSGMSKLARLLLLLAALWACYGGAAYLFARRLGAFAHAAVLAGIAVYGASIWLIAQAYHMDGNPPDAVLLWALGALLAAVLVRSRAALAAAFVLLTVWTCWERGENEAWHWQFLALWAAAVAATAWLDWWPGRHLAALSLGAWLVPLGYFVFDGHAHWLVVVIGVTAALAAIVAAPAIDRWTAAVQAIFSYAIAVAFAGLFIMQFIEGFNLLGAVDRLSTGQFGALAALTIALLIGAMFWALTSDNRGALWLGYIAFAVEIFAIYVRMLGTLLNTSLFFMIAALIVSALAWVAYRLHDRGAARQRASLDGLPAAPARGPARGGRCMNTRTPLLALAVVALAQTAVLAYMVVDRVVLVRLGREIVLPIVPVDPRDLFRGEYVRLSYGISMVPTALADGSLSRRNEVLYVVVEKKAGDEAWRVVSAARTFPGDLNPEQFVLKGRSLFSNATIATVHYGIESYFVPQGDGPRLEALARNRKLAALVAVDQGGNAAIKGIIIDGKLQYEEPLI
jgi:uncharacterized membrane protein/uncharacterized membrane-anchored protein